MPPCINHPTAVRDARRAAEAVFGADRIGEVHPTLATDDFGVLCSRIPSCYCFLGIRSERDEPQLLHTTTYRASHDALPYGIALLVNAALLTLTE